VEVSADGGHSWKDADLQSSVHRMAHTRFGIDWVWSGEECVLMSRCTDELGQLQPTLTEFARFLHQTPIDLFTKAMVPNGHNNYILPWKIDPDGNVQNGLA
jgi:sulfane dehydrogenase subunit SoxC